MKAITVYKARFEDGTIIAATSNEYKNRLGFYNQICKEQLGRKYGRLIEITCRPMPA